MSARETILARLRASRGGGNIEPVLMDHRRGPQPSAYADPIEHFAERARCLASSVARCNDLPAVPLEVSRYLDQLQLERHLVCWPELRELDWAGAQVEAECRTARPDDLVGVTGAFAAIAETGTLVMISGEETPPALSLLPETHIAVLRAERIVATMEDAFDLLRRERPHWPRAVNLISGPSRTADIEQTVTLGAHGPYRVHIIIVGGCP
jgi:L-lactate dehydrogenase complex protein LldG